MQCSALLGPSLLCTPQCLWWLRVSGQVLYNWVQLPTRLQGTLVLFMQASRPALLLDTCICEDYLFHVSRTVGWHSCRIYGLYVGWMTRPVPMHGEWPLQYPKPLICNVWMELVCGILQVVKLAITLKAVVDLSIWKVFLIWYFYSNTYMGLTIWF